MKMKIEEMKLDEMELSFNGSEFWIGICSRCH